MLEFIKNLLGIAPNETDKDETLRTIVGLTTARLKMLLGGIQPPEELDYIIIDVSIRRFNRIGSEGLTSHTVEGESLTFADSDFAAFSDDIQAFLNLQKASKQGKVRFI